MWDIEHRLLDIGVLLCELEVRLNPAWALSLGDCMKNVYIFHCLTLDLLIIAVNVEMLFQCSASIRELCHIINFFLTPLVC